MPLTDAQAAVEVMDETTPGGFRCAIAGIDPDTASHFVLRNQNSVRTNV